MRAIKGGNIRLLLLGEAGVGKSTLISAYISRHFPEEVPGLITESVIPCDKTSNYVSMTIMDSSARPGDREVLKQKIRVADTILVLFDTTRPETLDSIIKDWLPLIAEVCEQEAQDAAAIMLIRHNNGKTIGKDTFSSSALPSFTKSVAVVGTKKELLSDAENDFREREEVAKVRGLLRNFPCVHAYQRCSAKTLENVDNVFYLAELSVTFPLSPLYDCEAGDFTPACKRAFERIFRVVDLDQDGLLSDSELASLQVKCFDDPLSGNALAAIKKHIQHTPKGGALGLRDGKLTLAGFLCFLEMFIDKFNPQVPWLILQRFGYDDQLRLVVPPDLARLTASERRAHDAKAAELSLDAERFLRQLALGAAAARPCKSSSSNSNNGSGSGSGSGSSSSSQQALLTKEALEQILSVIGPGTQHPWAAPPLFAPSAPGEGDILIVLSDFPMAQSYQGDGEPILRISDWMSHWQLLALHCPATMQSLLFQLGYAERDDAGLVHIDVARPHGPSTLSSMVGFARKSKSSSSSSSSSSGSSSGSNSSSSNSRALSSSRGETDGPARSSVNACILGPRGAGKASLVCALSGRQAWKLSSIWRGTGTGTGAGTGSGTDTDDGVRAIESKSSIDSATGLPGSSSSAEMLSGAAKNVNLSPNPDVPAGFAPLSDSLTRVDSEELTNTTPRGNAIQLWRRRSAQTSLSGGQLFDYYSSTPMPTQMLLPDEDEDKDNDKDNESKQKKLRPSAEISVMDDDRGMVGGQFRNPVTIVATSVPEGAAFLWMTRRGSSLDVALLLFDATSMESFQGALRFEALLPELVPRLLVATHGDATIDVCGGGIGTTNTAVLDAAAAYATEHQLPPLLVVSSVSGDGVMALQRAVVRLADAPWLGVPIGVRKKRQAQVFHRYMLVGAVSAAAVAIAAFVVVRSRAAK